VLLSEGNRSGEVFCTSTRLVGCVRMPWNLPARRMSRTWNEANAEL
jgi:hypothetical protein